MLLALWLGGDGAGRGPLLRAVQSDDEPHTVRYEPGSNDAMRDDVTTGTALLSPGRARARPARHRDRAARARRPRRNAGRRERRGDRCGRGGPRAHRGAPASSRYPWWSGSAPTSSPGTWSPGRSPRCRDWRHAVHGHDGHPLPRPSVTYDRGSCRRRRRCSGSTWRAGARTPPSRSPRCATSGSPPGACRTGSTGERVRVLTSAARLRAIVALAAQDDGAAVNLWQADQRSTALRGCVDRMARRAMSAAATTLAV